jgi:predicted nucleic acid-binding protein
LKASALRAQHAFSFWDSTIVASALYADASVLYSEDMQDGLVVDNRVCIINPFKELQETSAESGESGI